VPNEDPAHAGRNDLSYTGEAVLHSHNLRDFGVPRQIARMGRIDIKICQMAHLVLAWSICKQARTARFTGRCPGVATPAAENGRYTVKLRISL